VAEAGVPLTDADLVDVLTAEAEARARGGQVAESRALLDAAWIRAAALGDPSHLGAVALGLDGLGARFAMPRTELVNVLDQARAALAGTGTPAEAQVTAALARQLQHSIPKDRSQARPLAEHAVAIARALDEPATLARCLLAQHDTLWTAGTATERVAIAREIAEHAEHAGDAERQSEALLLTASALLESGSPAFRATLAEYRYRAEALRQPRHDYVLRSREAALALLDGDLDTGERLIADAAELGAAAGDSDTGNVRMSQLLEVARARGDRARLRDTAQQAVEWWVGVPAHAHAVAAGFLARAGDLDGARRELDTVLALDDWRTDRSYLWSVFVGELATAAVALGDHPLCTLLLDDLLPVAGTCAVNGALVCFMGAHAHRVGLLHAALGRPADARDWLERALATHRQLGARAWEAETCSALATLGGAHASRHAARATELGAELGLHALTPSPAGTTESGTAATTVGSRDAAELRRVGDLWQASFRGQSAYLRDAKGLHDLAVLLARPGVDVPALELAGAAPASNATTAGAMAEQPVLDGAALTAYRRRLSELDEELAQADDTHDLGRQGRAAHEREQLLTELRRATRPGGGVRTLGLTAAERARKAVTSRIRDAIRRIDQAVPALGTHLDRCIRTGTTCRYDPNA
jgi:tetratricopeptide (TPR) repeat protein